jgi:hypothetical protein
MYTHDIALLGGIEAGGMKFVCGIGTCPDDLEVHSFPTVGPVESVRQAIQFFQDKAGSRLAGFGIARSNVRNLRVHYYDTQDGLAQL